MSANSNCVPDPKNGKYILLRAVLDAAYDQAAHGKGADRHNPDGENFEQQAICEMDRRLPGGARYQAVKKIYESRVLELQGKNYEAVAELLGAINYLAATAITIMQSKNIDLNFVVHPEKRPDKFTREFLGEKEAA